MTARPAIVWFRQDLRVSDHPALAAAAASGGAVVPVYIWAPEEEGAWPPGAASRWWLHRSLERLSEALAALGAPLIIRRGPSLDTLRALVRETGATTVRWSRRYEPAAVARDAAIKTALRADGLTVESHNAALLFEPNEIETAAGTPFQVFTPFWRACTRKREDFPLIPAPERLVAVAPSPTSLAVESLELEPAIDWAAGLAREWTPGARSAHGTLRRFATGSAAEYETGRDTPGTRGTSRLSPHLHFGEISPREVWEATPLAPAFRRQLIWREFAHHLLFHFPHTAEQPLREEFASFPWRTSPEDLRAWQRGRTGYPLVDAGMRELWETGWMHNRVRMVVASFLVKHLLISWQTGARWFWDTLVDADLANNTLGWQWTAGCGADAAPYFRIFNPALQQARFDAGGSYVARWVREPAADSPAHVAPVVEHQFARERALAALGEMKRARGAY